MSHHYTTASDRARRRRLGAGPSRRSERALRRGRRRHDGLRAEPHPGRRRLELDEPALRWRPPRHRVARGLREAAVRVGHRSRHDDRAVRRQQQLVRRLGVLAAQAVRPRRRPHPRRRAQVLAGPGPAADHRRPGLRGDGLRPARARLRAARLSRRHPAASRRRRARTRRRPFAGRVQRRDHRATRHDRDGPARRTHPGRRVDPVGADRQRGRHVQGRRRAGERSTRARASRRTRTSSPTAASASGRRTAGSCCTSCSGTSGSATTTARGPSTAA